MSGNHESKPEMEQYVGACKFCGQINDESYVEYESQEQADECATFKCECGPAERYKHRKLSLSRAQAQIENLFGDGANENGFITTETVIKELLFTLATLIYDEALKDVTINIDSASKVKISKSSKGKLKFKRSSANVIEKEA